MKTLPKVLAPPTKAVNLADCQQLVAPAFFLTKPLGCYGDGGACFTDDDELARKMSQIRIHGQDRRYHHPLVGINGRLDTLQAAILLTKWTVFEEELHLRATVAKRYEELLAGILTPPYVESFNYCVFAQYTVAVNERDELQGKLLKAGIPTAVHYPLPLHLQPVFASLLLPPGTYPTSEKAAAQVMSLPMHPYLDRETQQLVVNAIWENVSAS